MFSQINDKRFYFPKAILSLSFGHVALKELEKYKKKEGAENKKLFLANTTKTTRFGVRGSD